MTTPWIRCCCIPPRSTKTRREGSKIPQLSRCLWDKTSAERSAAAQRGRNEQLQGCGTLQHCFSQPAQCSQQISSPKCPTPGPPLCSWLCAGKPARAAVPTPPSWAQPQRAAALTMNSRMRPWAFTGGLHQPITTPSASFFRDS